MITDIDIQNFKQKARSQGYSESDIAAEIERKKQEEAKREAEQSKTLTLPNETPTAPKTQEQQPSIMQRVTDTAGGVVNKLAEFFLPRTTAQVKNIAGGVSLMTNNTENETRLAEANKLSDQASKTTDPEEKKRLLTQANQIYTEVSNSSREATAGMEDPSKQPSAAMQSLGTFGELASYVIPAFKAAKGANIVQRILTSAAGGSVTGALMGATTPEDISLEERRNKALTGALTGAAISGFLHTAIDIPTTGLKKFIGDNQGRIDRLFRLNPSLREDFEKSTKGMNFAEEIIKRDAKGIAGKDYRQMYDYFTTKFDEAYNKVNDTLKNSDETIPKSSIETLITTMAANLKPEKGNVGQSGAIAKLNEVLTDIKAIKTENLSLDMVNNIKRQLQDAGDAALSPNGSTSPVSKVMAKVSSKVKGLIETAVPEIEEDNKLTILYRTAKMSIQDTLNREANKISNDVGGKFLQQIPAALSVVGSAGGYAVGGLPGGVGAFVATQLLSGVTGAARVRYFTPEFQSKLVSWTQPIAEMAKKQGVKNADEFATRIINELSNVLIRKSQSGTSSEPGSTQPGSSAETGATPMTPEATGTPPLAEVPAASESEMVTIVNEDTGEIRTVASYELSQYGIDPETQEPTVQSEIPTKEEILSAMFLDMERTGGKNIGDLNTMLMAYEKVYGENQLSAQEKTAMKSAMEGLNLVDIIEENYQELQNRKLTAKKGGILNRLEGAAKGNYAALTQEGENGAAAATYASTINAFLSKLSRASGEKGVLTDKDIDRIQKAIPDFSDSPETAAMKLKTIREIIGGAIESK